MKTQEQTNLTTYSDRITSTLYSTKVTATGGRHGQIRSEDSGVDQKKAEELVESAHKICPYSNAIRGNVEVGITVSAR
jgi:organic hydroperoxide reductase OsmC/OhrA